MEWLETDGLGGFAMGTAVGIPMRRYHSLLNTAFGSPVNRISYVNAVEAWAIVNGKRYPLSTFSFGAENLHPNGVQYLKDFSCSPFPSWTFNFDGTEVRHELFVVKGSPLVALSWKVQSKHNVEIEVRPFLTGRSYHALHKENSSINLSAEISGEEIIWTPYQTLPSVYSYSNGKYQENKIWFKDVCYDEDRNRGSEYREDWASPGILTYNSKEAVLVLSSAQQEMPKNAVNFHSSLRKQEEKRRAKFKDVLSRAADNYIIERGTGKTIIAGYPWFADWGRDTFISMRGLCLANGRLEDAKNILSEWSKTVKDGMIPNRFVEEGSEPEYNSVDATLWFIIACYEYIQLDKKSAETFAPIIETIIDVFKSGTHYNIKLDERDGLLSAGVNGSQLTWMDAKIGNHVVTPRIGKPVEIQALWLNALKISYELSKANLEIFEQGLKSFNEKFWNPHKNCLYDVIDNNHADSTNDDSVRPNQLFAIGGLPFQILEEVKAKAVVDCVERELYTACGIRTLSPHDSQYRNRYIGDSFQRDTSYHQGTVWPWLMGPFIEAWVNVNGKTKKAKKDAIEKFFLPFIQNLNNSGLGHLSEIHDGDAPHNSRGCPFQAWSVAEALRLEKQVLS